MKARELSPTSLEALRALALWRPMTAGELAAEIFETRRKHPRAWARSAGRILWRLHGLGLVERRVEHWGTFWSLTDAGERARACASKDQTNPESNR